MRLVEVYKTYLMILIWPYNRIRSDSTSKMIYNFAKKKKKNNSAIKPDFNLT